jgi:hypothetical protein
MGMTRRSRRKTGGRWIRYLVTVLAALLAAFFGFFFVSGYVQEGAAPTAPAAQVALATKGGKQHAGCRQRNPGVGNDSSLFRAAVCGTGRKPAAIFQSPPVPEKRLLSVYAP